MPDKVSIIMAAYNAAQTIERAIYSIQRQTHTDWELWVIDDGSRDDTADRVTSLNDERIKLLCQENGGTAAARNHGLTHATGQWIAFLDADDRWLPSFLETALSTLTRQPNPVGLAYSWYYAVDEHDNLVTLSPAYQVNGVAFHDVLMKESLLLPSTTVMHADILKRAPAFLKEHIHEDREYYLRVCQQFPIYPMGARLVLYQQTAQGKCRALLKDYDKAVHAEMSIVTSVKHLLTDDDINKLEQSQKKGLFYRFLMYNFMSEARRLWGNASVHSLWRDKKGCLAALSLLTGISWLYIARLFVQRVILWTVQPWWKSKIRHWMTTG